ncbi:hypothetical protein ACJMK2_030763 [Sinanodonta woodiana]|uniref:Uncharacterized protein n=1 Tax=Sinanodonta woodiana TaxID=1069815 RepID=A0ABD3X0P4_SINWO
MRWTNVTVIGAALCVGYCLATSRSCVIEDTCRRNGTRNANEYGNVTLVTALYDIGRGNWSAWKRNFTIYLEHFKKVLSLNVHLAVFVDKSLLGFIKHNRHGKLAKTHVQVIQFSKLELFHFYNSIKDTMNSHEFLESNEMLAHPEAFSPEYVILMNNKIFFMKTIVDINPFGSAHFFWIDAGYGHGSDIFPNDGKWFPWNLMNIHRKITYIQLHNPVDYEYYVTNLLLHKFALAPAFNGGFFGGDAQAVREYYHLYHKVFRTLLVETIVDDDQNVALLCYFELPRLFNLVVGDWYDVFKLFN